MPANKKKKKPTGNPARGFATTSTASKAKPHDIAEDLLDPDPGSANHSSEAPQPGADDPSHEVSKQAERPLHELSPEDLENQLEESTLQLLIDSHGSRMRKDVSRQLARLRTERRILRNQALPLSTREWLPEEIFQLILYRLSEQQKMEIPLEKLPNTSNTDQGKSEDDLLIKLWTLKQLLPQLGFSSETTTSALGHLLKVNDHDDQKALSASKDSIWGLEECFSWLALEAEPEDLPRFEALDVQKPRTRKTKTNGSTTITEARSRTEATTPADSRPITPLSTDHSTDGDRFSSPESESDSDLEPEQLVEKYLGLQKRLYTISPESVQSNGKGKANPERRVSALTTGNHHKVNRTIDRLIVKLNKIKADILFDASEASRRWADCQVDLAREAADRRRLGIRDGIDPKEEVPPIDISNQAEALDNDEDNADMLEGLFDSLPASTNGLGVRAEGTGSEGLGKELVNIRDFGKWTGLSPRRILEEACKSRDSSAHMTYKLISESTFSKRHSLVVKWSQEQGPATSGLIPSLLYESDTHSFKVEMISVACPDAAQSEAYVSTIALFSLFASTPEQKVYMRLPSVWRDMWEELSHLAKEQQDTSDRDVLRELRSMIEETGRAKDGSSTNGSIPKFSAIPKKTDVESDISKAPQPSPAPSSDELKDLWIAKERTSSYQQMLSARMNLPVYNFKEELLLAITERQVVIICGETGCGKSTQVPAYILEHELSSGRSCKIYCTEPRRISAISLARRVSEELGERKGDVGTSRSLVGYAIRLESRMNSHTRLVYATTGIVMRMLENGVDELGDITHLVLDEVHERSIDSDFLLIVLRKLLVRRPTLRVVLMSATVDAQRFSNYLDHAPILNVPGRTFPVETKYLEDAIQETRFNSAVSTESKYGDEDDDDFDLTVDGSAKTSLSAEMLKSYSADTCNTLLKYDEYRLNFNLMLKLLVTVATAESYSSYSKAILVFLPGIAEIRRLNDMLARHSVFQTGWLIHSLHSTIAMEEQERAFLVPPVGTRKIVLATNIAETGITIPDVTCVIDTGKHKEMRFDERRQLSRLIEVFVSRANAKQRRGRAGRVQKGLCFHLFTKNRHDNIMPEEQTPEMLRLSLQDLVLRVKICRLGGVEHTLSEALDPPSSKNIRRAIDSLVDVKALTDMEDLTPLGRQLARLPLDVFLGKLVLLGVTFGCLDAMLTIAAILSSKSPFSAPMGSRSQMDVARLGFKKADSDLLTVYNAYCAWRRVCGANGMSEYQFYRKNFLSQQNLSNIEDLKAQLTASLADAGFLKLEHSEKSALDKVRPYSRKRSFVELPTKYDYNNKNNLILNSVIAWSFYPKLLRREGKGWRNVANNQTVSLHPTSVNKGTNRTLQWLSFYHIMQSSSKFYNAHETGPVDDFAIALVCGEAEFKMHSGVMVIDGNRIRFSLDDWKTILAIRALRTEIRLIMAQSFRNPERALSQRQQEWLGIWEKIFTSHGSTKS